MLIHAYLLQSHDEGRTTTDDVVAKTNPCHQEREYFLVQAEGPGTNCGIVFLRRT